MRTATTSADALNSTDYCPSDLQLTPDTPPPRLHSAYVIAFSLTGGDAVSVAFASLLPAARRDDVTRGFFLLSATICRYFCVSKSPLVLKPLGRAPKWVLLWVVRCCITWPWAVLFGGFLKKRGAGTEMWRRPPPSVVSAVMFAVDKCIFHTWQCCIGCYAYWSRCLYSLYCLLLKNKLLNYFLFI